VGSIYRIDMLDQRMGGMEKASTNFYHTENGVQSKTNELLISRLFHLIFLGHV
jgi:hypothetical protein